MVPGARTSAAIRARRLPRRRTSSHVRRGPPMTGSPSKPEASSSLALEMRSARRSAAQLAPVRPLPQPRPTILEEHAPENRLLERQRLGATRLRCPSRLPMPGVKPPEEEPTGDIESSTFNCVDEVNNRAEAKRLASPMLRRPCGSSRKRAFSPTREGRTAAEWVSGTCVVSRHDNSTSGAGKN
jgi:hypothetical protein